MANGPAAEWWERFQPAGRRLIRVQLVISVRKIREVADYTANNPLAAPAAGNQYCYINMYNSAAAGGIYQDVGALQPNTTYTLTVAIGSRADRMNSPGIISLINGTNNDGTVLVAGGGLPASQDGWHDYTATYITGAAVVSGILLLRFRSSEMNHHPGGF